MNQKLLSVITPVRNKVDFIALTVEAFLAEVEAIEHGLEWIIVDGASDDGTFEEIVARSEGLDFIHAVSEPDAGQSNAMNKGISRASGTFLTFLNADDFFEPGSLTFVLDRLSSLDTQRGFLIGNTNVLNADKQDCLISCNKPKFFGFPTVFEYWRYDVFPANPTAYFYARSLHDVAGLYDESDDYAMDYDFLVRVAKYADISYVDQLLGNFRYYKGCKTEASVTSGQNVARRNRIISRQLSSMSFLQRLKFRRLEKKYLSGLEQT